LITQYEAEVRVATYIVKSSQDPVCLSSRPTVSLLRHVQYAAMGTE